MHRAFGQLLSGLGNRWRRRRLARLRRNRQRRPCVDWSVGVDGHPWLRQLLEPAVTVLANDDADVVVTNPPAPFVNAALANPVQRHTPVGAPGDYTDLALSACRPCASISARGERALTIGDVARAHRAYREAHARTSVEVLGELAVHAGRPAPVNDDTVTVVCATNRPHELTRIAANVDRQRHPTVKLVVVLNGDDFSQGEVEAAFGSLADVQVLQRPAAATLGECLNAGLDLVSTRYVAKFDDDDEYGSNYLTDALIAHSFADAGIVGKHSHFARLVADGRVVLRHPGREFEYTSNVAGGTIVMDMSVVGHLRFPALDVGEDQAMLRACERAGHGVFAADPFNYVQRRHGTNTWSVDQASYLADAVDITDPESVFV